VTQPARFPSTPRRPASSAGRALRVIAGGDAVSAPGAVMPGAALEPLTIDAAFRAHAGFVASVALRVLGRPSEVDDLVQDVFLRAMSRLPELRDPDALRGWLAVITARLARRRLRGRRWKMWLGVRDDYDYAQLADGAASPEDRALLAELYRALDRLPVQQRVAWTLRHAEGMHLAAVAEACDCSLATVKRRIGAAESALRMEVDHE
jgi:RNA polymerase sigma-70 factor (ECF subfamily)